MKNSSKDSLSVLFLLICICLTACEEKSPPNASSTYPSSSDSRSISTTPDAGIGQNPARATGISEHQVSADGSVVLDRTAVSPAQIEAARNEYRRTNLIQLPVDASFNANVLRITDETIPEYKNQAFLAPRLYAYGTQEGGQVLPIRHDDGTVTLAFNIALVDGIHPNLSSPSGEGSHIDIPDSLLVHNPDELKQLLASQFHANGALSPLPGCPKKLTVVAAGTEYDATPSRFLSGDFCELNTPMTVSLTVRESEAKLIMEVELYAHVVDLQAVYETKVSYPTAKVSVKFDRSKIYHDLQTALGVKAYYVDAEVKIATTKVMQSQMLQVTVQGETSEFANQLIDKVTAEFFEPWIPTPNAPENPCGPTTPVCLRFSSTSQEQSSLLNFDWDESSNLLSGQNYVMSTKLKATPNLSRIGEVDASCRSNTQHTCAVPLSNRGEKVAETGLTVVNGNQVTVEPTYIIREHRDQGIPTPIRTDHLICVGSTHPECERRDGFPIPVCAQVCDQTENHWTETTTYTIGDPAPEIISEPAGQMQELLDGLAFRFRWMDQTSGVMKSLDCPLADFPREGNGRNLVVRVQNTPTCSPFTGALGETPMLYLLNRVRYTETYETGRRVTQWDGTVSESPVIQSFEPEVGFAGTISIQGYAFESEKSDGQVLR